MNLSFIYEEVQVLKKIKVVHIYFLSLILLFLGYFIENPLKRIGFYEQLEKYFGLTQIPIFLFLVVYGLLFLKKKSVKRAVLEIKLCFLLIVIVLGLFTYIIYNSGLNFINIEKIELNEDYFKNLIEISLYKYSIGYIFTYLLFLIVSLNFAFYKIFYILLAIQLILIILIIFSPIKNYLKKSIREYKEKKRTEKEERLLKEQIKIKEALEKKETLKKVKFRENKEKMLEEKVEIFKKIQLTKTVNLNEKIGDNK